jgi:FkbM family methyltransferase
MLINLNFLSQKYKFIPKGVIHCGAHMCEEKRDYDSLGIKNVIWIEGNPEIFESIKLLNEVKNDIVLNELLWENSDQELQFHITNNGQSSSILQLEKHLQYHPEVHNIKTITRKTKTLNSIFKENNFDINKYDFINLDLQGVELNVLKGFDEYLSHIKYIYTEVNTGEVYKNCSKMNEIDLFLSVYGFERVETDITRAEWGDAFYIKK